MLECKGLNKERLLIYFFDSIVQLRDSGSEIISKYIGTFLETTSSILQEFINTIRFSFLRIYVLA